MRKPPGSVVRVYGTVVFKNEEYEVVQKLEGDPWGTMRLRPKDRSSRWFLVLPEQVSDLKIYDRQGNLQPKKIYIPKPKKKKQRPVGRSQPKK